MHISLYMYLVNGGECVEERRESVWRRGGRCVRRKGRRCEAGFLNSLRVNIAQNAM